MRRNRASIRSWIPVGGRGLWHGPDADSGATSVEFGMIATLFFTALFGILEFGRLLFTLGVLHFAAQEATRFATVNWDATTQQIQDVAEANLVLISPENITNFVVTNPLDPSDQTRLVTVTIDYRFDFLLPLVYTSSIDLTGSSRGFLVEE